MSKKKPEDEMVWLVTISQDNSCHIEHHIKDSNIDPRQEGLLDSEVTFHTSQFKTLQAAKKYALEQLRIQRDFLNSEIRKVWSIRARK